MSLKISCFETQTGNKTNVMGFFFSEEHERSREVGGHVTCFTRAIKLVLFSLLFFFFFFYKGLACQGLACGG